MSSTLNIFGFPFPRPCVAGKLRLADAAHSIVHRTIKVKILVRRTNWGYSCDSACWGNACLSFWKLRTPNLIPGLSGLPKRRQNLFWEQNLKQQAGHSGQQAGMPGLLVEAGNDQRK